MDITDLEIIFSKWMNITRRIMDINHIDGNCRSINWVRDKDVFKLGDHLTIYSYIILCRWFYPEDVGIRYNYIRHIKDGENEEFKICLDDVQNCVFDIKSNGDVALIVDNENIDNVSKNYDRFDISILKLMLENPCDEINIGGMIIPPSIHKDNIEGGK